MGAYLGIRTQLGFQSMWAGLATALFLLRFYIHRFRSRRDNRALLASDILSTLAICCLWTLAGIVTWYYNLAVQWTDSPRSADPDTHPWFSGTYILKVFFFGNIVYIMSLWFLKGAWCAMYYEIFPAKSQSRKARFMMAFLAVYTCATFVSLFLAYFLHCRPLALSWQLDGKCQRPFKSKPLIVATYALNVSNDLLILILPFLVLSTLTLHRTQLTAFIFIILLGLFTLAASSLRLYFMLRSAVNEGGVLDQLTDVYGIDTWSSAECWSVFMAFGLLPLRVYLRRFTASGRGTTWQSGERGGGAGGSAASRWGLGFARLWSSVAVSEASAASVDRSAGTGRAAGRKNKVTVESESMTELRSMDDAKSAHNAV